MKLKFILPFFLLFVPFVFAGQEYGACSYYTSSYTLDSCTFACSGAFIYNTMISSSCSGIVSQSLTLCADAGGTFNRLKDSGTCKNSVWGEKTATVTFSQMQWLPSQCALKNNIYNYDVCDAGYSFRASTGSSHSCSRNVSETPKQISSTGIYTDFCNCGGKNYKIDEVGFCLSGTYYGTVEAYLAALPPAFTADECTPAQYESQTCGNWMVDTDDTRTIKDTSRFLDWQSMLNMWTPPSDHSAHTFGTYVFLNESRTLYFVGQVDYTVVIEIFPYDPVTKSLGTIADSYSHSCSGGCGDPSKRAFSHTSSSLSPGWYLINLQWTIGYTYATATYINFDDTGKKLFKIVHSSGALKMDEGDYSKDFCETDILKSGKRLGEWSANPSITSNLKCCGDDNSDFGYYGIVTQKVCSLDGSKGKWISVVSKDECIGSDGRRIHPSSYETTILQSALFSQYSTNGLDGCCGDDDWLNGGFER